MRPKSLLVVLVLVVAALLLFCLPVNQITAVADHSPPQYQQASQPAQAIENTPILIAADNVSIERTSISDTDRLALATSHKYKVDFVNGQPIHREERNPLGPKLNYPLASRSQLYIKNS